jgi:Phage tail protein
MPLLDEQFSYRGLTFGPGCDIMINRAEGFEGFEARTSDSDQPRADGGIRGLDYVAPRTVAFELVAVETDDLDGSIYEGLWAAVRAAFQPSRDTDYDLTFKRPGMPERVIRCRPISLVRSEEFLKFNRVGFPPVVLRAVDPRIYSTAVRQGTVAPFSPTPGGTELPVEFAADFTGGTQVEFVAVNAGTADAFPLIRFFGPGTGTVTGVKLTNSTTGAVLQVNTTMTTGQILTCDMTAAATGANRLIISLDGSSRYGSWQLPRSAFSLAPGSNTLRFEITGTSTNAACTVAWSDTWID